MRLAPPPPSAPPPSSTGGRGATSGQPSATPATKQTTAFSSFYFYFPSHPKHLLTSCLLVLSLHLLAAPGCDAKEVFTNHFYVKLHPGPGGETPQQLAHRVAKRNGFHALGPVLGSDHEFHFVHHGLAHARHKRSVPHARKLKADPQVSVAKSYHMVRAARVLSCQQTFANFHNACRKPLLDQRSFWLA